MANGWQSYLVGINSWLKVLKVEVIGDGVDHGGLAHPRLTKNEDVHLLDLLGGTLTCASD